MSPMTEEQIAEALKASGKRKKEAIGTIDRMIECIEKEIEMLGKQREARKARYERVLAEGLREVDERADYCIMRKDYLRDLRKSLNGEEVVLVEPVQLALPAPDAKNPVPTAKKSGRLKRLFRRKARK